MLLKMLWIGYSHYRLDGFIEDSNHSLFVQMLIS